MSEAEAHAFEVNSFGLYNELSGLVGLGSVDNNFNTSNSMLPLDRELSADDYMELNDLLAPDPSFPSEFPDLDNQYMHYPLDEYNGHYDVTTLSGPLEPTMPSIFDAFPPSNNGVLATDVAADYLDPTMQFPFS